MKVSPLKRAVESKSDDPAVLGLLVKHYTAVEVQDAYQLAQNKKKVKKAEFLQEVVRATEGSAQKTLLVAPPWVSVVLHVFGTHRAGRGVWWLVLACRTSPGRDCMYVRV